MDNSVMEKLITDYCEHLKKTLIQKNNAYGNSHFKTADEYGYMVLSLRIEDKVNRVKQLLRNPSTNKGDEAVQDTFLDCAGYSVLAGIYLASKNKGVSTNGK
jgi:hypothetical protein